MDDELPLISLRPMRLDPATLYDIQMPEDVQKYEIVNGTIVVSP